MRAARPGSPTRGVVFTALAILMIAMFGLFGGFASDSAVEARGDQTGVAIVEGQDNLALIACTEPNPLLESFGEWFCETTTVATTSYLTTLTQINTEAVTVTTTTTESLLTSEAATESTTTTETLVVSFTESTTTTDVLTISQTLTNTTTASATVTATSVVDTQTATIKCLLVFFLCEPVNGNGTITFSQP